MRFVNDWPGVSVEGELELGPCRGPCWVNVAGDEGKRACMFDGFIYIDMRAVV